VAAYRVVGYSGVKKLSTYLALLALFAAGPMAASVITSSLTLSLMAQATFAAILAVSVGFLIRQNGMISFGQAAFFGLPGYAIAALIPNPMVPAEIVIVGAVLATGLLAFGVGLAIVRVHGIAFGMLTLALGQGVYEAATHLRGVTGGYDGASLRHFPQYLFGAPFRMLQQPGGMLVVAWLLMATILTSVWLFSLSHWGRLTEGIRDNEERIRFLGYGTRMPRALVFAASAMIAAIAGVLSTVYNAFISPESLHWTASGAPLIMAVLGGSGAPWGPVVGAFTYFFLKQVAGLYTTHWLSVIGGALILVSVFFPSGLAGLITRGLRATRKGDP